jgi:hypothetical protein
MSDDLDLLLTVVKEPDWFTGGYSGWMSNQPLVPAQGTLELHTRRFNGSQTQVVMWGNFNIDPTIFFTNFFNWNQQPYNNPFPIYTVPHCFASVTATGQPQPGYWQAVVPGSQDKFLVGYTLTGNVTVNHPGMGGPAPGGGQLILLFNTSVQGVPGYILSPSFMNGDLHIPGDFAVYYGVGSQGVNQPPTAYPGYSYQGAGPLGMSLWQITSSSRQ